MMATRVNFGSNISPAYSSMYLDLKLSSEYRTLQVLLLVNGSFDVSGVVVACATIGIDPLAIVIALTN